MRISVFNLWLLTAIVLVMLNIHSVSAATHVYDYCKVGICNNKTVHGSKYCSEHKCQMQGCLERADNSGYCLKHKTWASKKKKTDDASDECSVNGCTMYKTKDGDFCLYHTCNRSRCHKQKISGSVYCRKHAK